jgi:hypothetical protein
MTTLTFRRFESSLLKQGEVRLRQNGTSPTNHYLILCYGTLDENSTLEEILATELTEVNGYQRELLTFNTGVSQGNLPNLFYRFSANAVTITPSGSNLTINSIVAIANASVNANKSVVSMVESTDIITVTGHGLTINDAVMFTEAGTIATGLEKNTIYYARDITTDTFKVSATSGGDAIDLTADSSGSLLMRYANGYPEFFASFGGDQSLVDGQSQSFTVSWDEKNVTI